MNEIGVDWTSLVPVLFFYKVLLVVMGGIILYDCACLVGFLDGPKAPLFFKLLYVVLATGAAGLIFFSLAGDICWMFNSTIAVAAAYGLLRLWSWSKGLHLSKFVLGKSVKMK